MSFQMPLGCLRLRFQGAGTKEGRDFSLLCSCLYEFVFVGMQQTASHRNPDDSGLNHPHHEKSVSKLLLALIQ